MRVTLEFDVFSPSYLAHVLVTCYSTSRATVLVKTITSVDIVTFLDSDLSVDIIIGSHE